MPQNDFLAFATDPAANVLDQASYAALAALPLGYSAGIAQSNQLNKTWRQSSVISRIVAQYISNQTGQDVLDNGDLAALLAQFSNAITVGSGVKPARVVTVSTALVLTAADYAVGLARIAAPAATTASLPTAQTGQEFAIEDLVGNFATYPVTVSPPAGENIAGLATFVCNINRQSAKFRRYSTGAWSVKS